MSAARARSVSSGDPAALAGVPMRAAPRAQPLDCFEHSPSMRRQAAGRARLLQSCRGVRGQQPCS